MTCPKCGYALLYDEINKNWHCGMRCGFQRYENVYAPITNSDAAKEHRAKKFDIRDFVT